MAVDRELAYIWCTVCVKKSRMCWSSLVDLELPFALLGLWGTPLDQFGAPRPDMGDALACLVTFSIL